MNRRSWTTLAGIAAIVAILGLTRGGTRDADVGAESVEPSAAALPTILDFGRGTCIPCQQMMPVLEEVRAAYRGKVEVRYLDLSVEPNAERARELGVKLIPTQVFLAADGTETYRHEGFLPREAIDRKLVELGWIAPR